MKTMMVTTVWGAQRVLLSKPRGDHYSGSPAAGQATTLLATCESLNYGTWATVSYWKSSGSRHVRYCWTMLGTCDLTPKNWYIHMRGLRRSVQRYWPGFPNYLSCTISGSYPLTHYHAGKTCINTLWKSTSMWPVWPSMYYGRDLFCFFPR